MVTWPKSQVLIGCVDLMALVIIFNGDEFPWAIKPGPVLPV